MKGWFRLAKQKAFVQNNNLAIETRKESVVIEFAPPCRLHPPKLKRTPLNRRCTPPKRFSIKTRYLFQKKSTPNGVLFLLAPMRESNVHRPVRKLVDPSIFSHAVSLDRPHPLPCEKMHANLSITSKKCSIPFPRYAYAPRKLHIRKFLLPSPNWTRCAGLRLGKRCRIELP